MEVEALAEWVKAEWEEAVEEVEEAVEDLVVLVDLEDSACVQVAVIKSLTKGEFPVDR